MGDQLDIAMLLPSAIYCNANLNILILQYLVKVIQSFDISIFSLTAINMTILE